MFVCVCVFLFILSCLVLITVSTALIKPLNFQLVLISPLNANTFHSLHISISCVKNKWKPLLKWLHYFSLRSSLFFSFPFTSYLFLSPPQLLSRPHLQFLFFLDLFISLLFSPNLPRRKLSSQLFSPFSFPFCLAGLIVFFSLSLSLPEFPIN